MGKHTQRKPGYLPKVAAGAAPLALLLAGPASAAADPTLPLDGLPLDLRHGGPDHFAPASVSGVRGTASDAVRMPPCAGSALRPPASEAESDGLSDSLTAVKAANGSSPVAARRGGWRPYGVDALADPSGGAGRFTGDLHGGVVAPNSGAGQFAGSLDLPEAVGPVSEFLLTAQSLPRNGFEDPAPARVGPPRG
ncbi:hypothetical protein ACWEOE_01100 [Amycolatopsis sp. NPDC004368]